MTKDRTASSTSEESISDYHRKGKGPEKKAPAVYGRSLVDVDDLSDGAPSPYSEPPRIIQSRSDIFMQVSHGL